MDSMNELMHFMKVQRDSTESNLKLLNKKKNKTKIAEKVHKLVKD